MRADVWTQDELAVLREYYPAEGIRIAARLAGRSLKAISFKAYAMGLRSTERNQSHGAFWTAEEIAVLRDRYPVDGLAVEHLFPKRSLFAIKSKVSELGLKIQGVRGRVTEWTPEEDSIVRQFYPHEGAAVADRLPGRTIGAVLARAKTLKVKSDVLVGSRVKLTDGAYAKILKDANRALTATEQLAKLPWLKMPTTVAGCHTVAACCDDVLASPLMSGSEARVFFSSLKGHVLALSERLEKLTVVA